MKKLVWLLLLLCLFAVTAHSEAIPAITLQPQAAYCEACMPNDAGDQPPRYRANEATHERLCLKCGNAFGEEAHLGPRDGQCLYCQAKLPACTHPEDAYHGVLVYTADDQALHLVACPEHNVYTTCHQPDASTEGYAAREEGHVRICLQCNLVLSDVEACVPGYRAASNGDDTHSARCQMCSNAVAGTAQACVPLEGYVISNGDGTHINVCGICDGPVGEAAPCTAGDAYSFTSWNGTDPVSDHHFLTCTQCYQPIPATMEPHVPSGEVHGYEGGYHGSPCAVCGYDGPEMMEKCTPGQEYRQVWDDGSPTGTHKPCCGVCQCPIDSMEAIPCTPDEWAETNGNGTHKRYCAVCFGEARVEACTLGEGVASNWNGTHSSACGLCYGPMGEAVPCTPGDWCNSNQNGTHSAACSLCYGPAGEAFPCTPSEEEYITNWDGTHSLTCTLCRGSSGSATAACVPGDAFTSNYNDTHSPACTVCSGPVGGAIPCTPGEEYAYNWNETHSAACTECHGPVGASFPCTVGEGYYSYMEGSHAAACAFCHGPIGEQTRCSRSDDYFSFEAGLHNAVCPLCEGPFGMPIPCTPGDEIVTTETGEQWTTCSVCKALLNPYNP